MATQQDHPEGGKPSRRERPPCGFERAIRLALAVLGLGMVSLGLSSFLNSSGFVEGDVRAAGVAMLALVVLFFGAETFLRHGKG